MGSLAAGLVITGLPIAADPGISCVMVTDTGTPRDTPPAPGGRAVLPERTGPVRQNSRQMKPLGASRVLIGLIGLICLPELVLFLADTGIIGTLRWRSLAYQYGAFWTGLLYGWKANYGTQPLLMFITYGFLHTGPGHLIGNMLGLGWLGKRVIDRWGAGRFIWLYLTAMLGGAAGFGVLAQNPAPMVGASGALFGLMAAWMVGEWQDRRRSGQAAGQSHWAALKPALGLTLALIGFNLITWVLQSGALAWETHLGGFLAGGLVALILVRTRAQRRTGPA